MKTGWYWARGWRRRGAQGLGLLVLLLALGAGGTMAAAAGARRTSSADERLAAVSNPPEAGAFAADDEALELITSRPEVERSSGFIQLGLQPSGVPCDSSDESYFQVLVPVSGTPFGTPKPRLIEGRFPPPTATDEAVLSEQHARRLGVGVGDRIDYLAYDVDEEVSGCLEGTVASVRVVGIIREYLEIGTDEPTAAATYVTPAFVEANPDAPVVTFAGVFAWVDLKEGASTSDFVESATAALPADDEGNPVGGMFPFAPASALSPALDALSVGLWALAAVLAVATAVTAAVMISRQTATASQDLRVMSALGASGAQVVAAAALRPAGALLASLPLAAAVAVVLSAVHLVGVARLVEPDPGVTVDTPVLLLGLGGTTLLVVLALAVASVRAALEARRPEAPAPMTRTGLASIVRRAAPPWAAIGAGYALERTRRHRTLPTRGAGTALVAATTGMLAVLVFGVGVGRANEDPGVYGYGDWDGFASVSDDAREDSVDLVRVLQQEPGIDAIADLSIRFKLELDGETHSGMPVDHVRGASGPTLVEGRLPEGDDEIALGRDTARDLGVGIGDSVRAAGPERTRSLEVVGIAAFPAFDSDAIARGWVAERDAVTALGWGDGCNDEAECFETVAVSYRDSADADAVIARLRERDVEIDGAAPGLEVTLISEADQVPGLAAAGVGVIAAVGLLHALTATVNRRRRELSTMRAIGFRRAQASGVIMAEALTLGLLGAVVGGLLGYAIGRGAWTGAAEHIGIGPSLPSTLLLTLAVCATVVLLTVVLAIVPSVRAGRLSLADALRDE